MIEILTLIFLFYLLTPGILWSYRKKTNKYLIGLLHAAVFAFIWNVIQNFKEGLVVSVSEDEDEDKLPIALKFVLDTDLYSDPEVIAKINTMEGPPIIVGASQIRGPTKNKSSLLFTNDKNKTSKLDDLIKVDIVDPTQKKINGFIDFHKKYPEM